MSETTCPFCGFELEVEQTTRAWSFDKEAPIEFLQVTQESSDHLEACAESRRKGLTAYEKRIEDYAQEHGHRISRGKVQRLALRLYKRGERMHDETLERLFMHADPTPQQAFRNIEREGAQQS
jgi:hypothetical protein